MSWVDHVHHTGVSRCFWYLGWRKTSALPYLFLYIVQYCINHTHTHTHSTILGWCLGLPFQEILTRTSNLPWMMDQFSNGSIPNAWQVGKNYLVQAIPGPVSKHSKTFKNHIQETCAKYEPWNAKALNWHCPLYEKAYRIPSIHIPCHIPSRIPAHVQCLGTANSCRLLLWALRPVFRQCTAPAYRHHPGSHRISSARTSPGFLINLSAMRYPTT